MMLMLMLMLMPDANAPLFACALQGCDTISTAVRSVWVLQIIEPVVNVSEHNGQE
jgi:hypothetical protein